MKQLILIAILATTAGLARAEQQCYFTLTADPESAMPSYLGQGMLVTKAGQAVVQRMGWSRPRPAGTPLLSNQQLRWSSQNELSGQAALYWPNTQNVSLATITDKLDTNTWQLESDNGRRALLRINNCIDI